METKRKQRLSCGLISIIILSIGLAATVLTVELMKRHYRNKALAAIPEGERPELFKWLAAPVDTPHYKAEHLNPLPNDYATRFLDFEMKANTASNNISAVGQNPTLPVVQQLVDNEALTSSQTELLLMIVQSGDELLSQGLPLISDPLYTANDRKFPWNATVSDFNFPASVLAPYTVIKALSNEWNNVLGATELLCGLMNSDGGLTWNNYNKSALVCLSTDVTSLTTEPKLLRQLLEIATGVQTELLKGESDSAYFNNAIYISHWMLNDGYIKQLPKTREEYLRLKWDQYLEWLPHARSIKDTARKDLAVLQNFETDMFWHKTKTELFLEQKGIGLLKLSLTI